MSHTPHALQVTRITDTLFQNVVTGYKGRTKGRRRTCDLGFSTNNNTCIHSTSTVSTNKTKHTCYEYVIRGPFWCVRLSFWALKQVFYFQMRFCPGQRELPGRFLGTRQTTLGEIPTAGSRFSRVARPRLSDKLIWRYYGQKNEVDRTQPLLIGTTFLLPSVLRNELLGK